MSYCVECGCGNYLGDPTFKDNIQGHMECEKCCQEFHLQPADRVDALCELEARITALENPTPVMKLNDKVTVIDPNGYAACFTGVYEICEVNIVNGTEYFTIKELGAIHEGYHGFLSGQLKLENP